MSTQLEGRCFGSPEADRQERINREKLIETFNFALSAPYRCFKDKGWTDMRLPELAVVGEVLAFQSDVHLGQVPPECRLETHWDKFRPNVGCICRIFNGNLDDPRPSAGDLP
jgi:hypothetical protein